MFKTRWFLIGFISNSVLLRLSGKLPMDDFIYPATILSLLVVSVIIEKTPSIG